MSCWVVIPVKAPSAAKGRLAGVLDHAARVALARAMLDRVTTAVLAADGVDGLALIGPERLGQPDTIELLADPGRGLNPALAFARDVMAARGASRVVTLAGDLPLITPADVEALCRLPFGAMGIAPDRHGTGTNALSLPLPAALDLRLSYGPGSCDAHRAEAARLGLRLEVLATPGLSRDVDEASDLGDASALKT